MVKQKPKTIRSKRPKTTKGSDADAEIIEKETSDAQGLIKKLSSGDAKFAKSWSPFVETFNKMVDGLDSYKTFVEGSKATLSEMRERLVSNLTNIVPALKKQFGPQGSKHKIAFTIAANLPIVESGSVFMVRRLLDRYEDIHGPIYPKELEDEGKDAAKGMTDERHVDLYYGAFEKGKDEMVSLFEDVIVAMQSDVLDKVRLFITTRDKIKHIKIYTREK